MTIIVEFTMILFGEDGSEKKETRILELSSRNFNYCTSLLQNKKEKLKELFPDLISKFMDVKIVSITRKQTLVHIKTSGWIVERLMHFVENKSYTEFPNKFTYPNTIVKDSLLFLGLTPPFPGNQKMESYHLQQSGNDHPDLKTWENISRYCKTPWSYFNLLFFRETEKNITKNILSKENGKNFIHEQLQIAADVIKMSKPKIIVVTNALAGTFLGFDKKEENTEWLNLNFKFDSKIGTYRLNGIPVFFSNMQGDQQGLDKGSFERLKWQIRRTLILLNKEEIGRINILKNLSVRKRDYEQSAYLRDQEQFLRERIADLEFQQENLSTEGEE